MATIVGGYDTNQESSQAALRRATLTRVGTKDYLDVRAVIVGSTPNTETGVGSDCSGTDGQQNRVWTCTNTATTQNELVCVNGIIQTVTADYTVSHKTTGTTITFLSKIYDADLISVRYFT